MGILERRFHFVTMNKGDAGKMKLPVNGPQSTPTRSDGLPISSRSHGQERTPASPHCLRQAPRGMLRRAARDPEGADGGESAKPPSTPTGAVFLSYASQDAEAAQRICEALRAAGIEVWLMTQELGRSSRW